MVLVQSQFVLSMLQPQHKIKNLNFQHKVQTTACGIHEPGWSFTLEKAIFAVCIHEDNQCRTGEEDYGWEFVCVCHRLVSVGGNEGHPVWEVFVTNSLFCVSRQFCSIKINISQTTRVFLFI